MAFFDWNQNGKNDMFDSFMDYQVYKDTFGEEDEYDYEDDYEDEFEGDFDDGTTETVEETTETEEAEAK